MQKIFFQNQAGLVNTAAFIVVLLWMNAASVVNSNFSIPDSIFKTLLKNGEINSVRVQK